MKKIAVFFVMFLFIFGCNDPLQEIYEPEPELKKGKMVERTIKFQKATGIMQIVEEVESCTPDKLQMVISGGGNASHIGNFSVTNWICIDALLNPASAITGEIIAANGDKICTMVTKAPWVDEKGINYYYSVRTELCTGRFKDATGYIIMWGIIDYGTMTFDLKGEGKIKY